MKINKKFISAFITPAIFLWFFSWWGPKVYLLAVNELYPSQVAFMLHILKLVLPVSLIYLIILIRSINSRKRLNLISVVRESGIFYATLFLIMCCAILISLFRLPANFHLLIRSINEIQLGITTFSLKLLMDLTARVMDAEGLDLFFCFGLALIREHLLKNRTEARTYRQVWIVWLIIILINELIVQPAMVLGYKMCPSIFPDRDISLWDIAANMGGISFALFLSNRWFWKSK